MLKQIARAASACVLAFGLYTAVAARADEAPAQKPATGDATCSCKSCNPDVCCKAPTGFQPLDDKCKNACERKTWAPAPGQQCGTQSGCCP